MLKNRKLGSVRQMDKELKKAKEIQNPANGWINSIRRLLNISLQQLGNYAGLTGQGVYALEKREKEGKITLKKLREIASVFDMHVVYAFIPRTSLEEMIEKKAKEKAREIVQRSHQNMKLEAQEVDKDAIEDQVREITNELKNSLSNTLWQ